MLRPPQGLGATIAPARGEWRRPAQTPAVWLQSPALATLLPPFILTSAGSQATQAHCQALVKDFMAVMCLYHYTIPWPHRLFY